MSELEEASLEIGPFCEAEGGGGGNTSFSRVTNINKSGVCCGEIILWKSSSSVVAILPPLCRHLLHVCWNGVGRNLKNCLQAWPSDVMTSVELSKMPNKDEEAARESDKMVDPGWNFEFE